MGGKNFLASVKQEISKNYPGAKIELRGPFRWAGNRSDAFKRVQFLGDDGRGTAHILIEARPNGKISRLTEGWVQFSATVEAKVALRRVRPGEPLLGENFLIRPIEVATGNAHEYRSSLVDSEVLLSGLEATQTILEGQFLLMTSVRQTPDFHRGDSVQIQLTTNGISLTVPGIIEEPGYFHKPVRVIAGKQKRELKGILLPGGTVEVSI